MIEQWVTVDDQRPVEKWADCLAPGCQNKRCARLGSQYCYPHSNDPASLITKSIEDMLAGRVPSEVTGGADAKTND